MKITFALLFSLCLFNICGIIPSDIKSINTSYRDQVRQTAIQDFLKTKLFKRDSVFYVTWYDTLHQIIKQRVDKQKLKVVEKDFPEIIVVNIVATQFKYLLDTTAKINNQNRTIPSRVFEKNGKLFLWRDKHYPVTESTIKILDKFNLIQRGTNDDMERFLNFGTDDARLGAAYYFCRNNLFKYMRIISDKGIGYYNPPNVRCKP